MNSTQQTLDIETLVAWGPAKEVQTQRGRKRLRTAPMTDGFWTAWRSAKEELRAAGVSCGKDRAGNWEAMWWLPSTPTFDGPVVRGARYLAVDDVVTTGSSLMALRRHLEDGGAQVSGFCVLAAASSQQMGWSGHLSLMPETEKLLLKRFDAAALNAILREHGIADGMDRLTNSQGRYVAMFKTVDALRSRIAQSIEENRPATHRQQGFKQFQGAGERAATGHNPGA